MEEKKFLTIQEAAERTGLAVYYIRQGIKKGKIPYIRCGNKAMVNIKKFLEMLDEESGENLER